MAVLTSNSFFATEGEAFSYSFFFEGRPSPRAKALQSNALAPSPSVALGSKVQITSLSYVLLVIRRPKISPLFQLILFPPPSFVVKVLCGFRGESSFFRLFLFVRNRVSPLVDPPSSLLDAFRSRPSLRRVAFGETTPGRTPSDRFLFPLFFHLACTTKSVFFFSPFLVESGAPAFCNFPINLLVVLTCAISISLLWFLVRLTTLARFFFRGDFSHHPLFSPRPGGTLFLSLVFCIFSLVQNSCFPFLFPFGRPRSADPSGSSLPPHYLNPLPL